MRKFWIFLIVASAWIVTSCGDEPEPILFNGPHIVSFSRTSLTVNENTTSPARIRVTVSRTFTSDVTINFTLTEFNAIRDVDYTVTQQSIVIPANEYFGEFVFQTIDNDEFDLARRVTVTMTSISEPSLQLSAEKAIVITILNDDCPVNTGVWVGDVEADEDGYEYTATLGPNDAGDCNILLIENIGDWGYLGTLKPIVMVFTPDGEGATFGTVSIANQGLGIVSDGAGGFTGSGQRSVEGDGVYDEESGIIELELTYRVGSGAVWYTATQIFYAN